MSVRSEVSSPLLLGVLFDARNLNVKLGISIDIIKCLILYENILEVAKESVIISY
jgi:hypothetical protein